MIREDGLLLGKFLLRGEIIIKNILSWDEFNNKMNNIFGKSFRVVDELYFNIEKEINIGERRILDDYQVLKYLQELHEIEGPVYVITDLCYEKKYGGAFFVEANSMAEFVQTYKNKFGEAFYSTDIIIISFEIKLIWVFHHEGVCWLSKG